MACKSWEEADYEGIVATGEKGSVIHGPQGQLVSIWYCPFCSEELVPGQGCPADRIRERCPKCGGRSMKEKNIVGYDGEVAGKLGVCGDCGHIA